MTQLEQAREFNTTRIATPPKCTVPRDNRIEVSTACELTLGTTQTWIKEVVMRPYCKQFCKELTVEEEAGGNIVNRKLRFTVYSIVGWFDDSGIYHELILFGSDPDWVSEMHIAVEDLNG